MLLSSLAGSLLLAFAPGPDALGQVADPQSIVGGSEATTCQWPSVVSMLENDATPVMCSGSLIHPQVVLTAAHCIIPERPIVAVGFGEHGQVTGEPVRVVETVQCVGYPPYYEGAGADVGYCLLAEAVVGLPIVPLLAGCETSQVNPGTEVTIVGYGATWGSYDDEGILQTMGVGTKRWTTQTVDFIDSFFEEINLYGDTGSQSACFGDSGGPALVRLDDGTWRVLGTGSHLYDPGNLPPPEIPDNFCGAGAAYGYVPYGLEWLETASGFDLTPCWDGDVWVGEPGCGDFPLEADLGIGAWSTGCVGGAVGGGVAPACAELPPEETTGSESDGGTTTWEPDETTGGWDGDTSGGPPPPPPADSGDATTGRPDPRPPEEPPPWTTGDDAASTGSSGSGDEAGLDGGGFADRGCACSTRDDRSLAPLGLFVLAGLARRRLRRRARA